MKKSMNTNKEFVDLLRAHFFEKLQIKTNWGHNQIARAFEQSVADSYIYMMDHSEKPSMTAKLQTSENACFAPKRRTKFQTTNY